jgi:predicted Fe-Mo cluster-binding NifX family protein
MLTGWPAGCYVHSRMRIAIANWDNRVSPVLDTAASLTVVDVGAAAESGRTLVRLGEAGLCGRARQMGGLGLDVLICGALSRPLYEALMVAGVEVVAFVAGDVSTVLDAYLAGRLPDRALTLPGCRCRWRRMQRTTAAGGPTRIRRGAAASRPAPVQVRQAGAGTAGNGAHQAERAPAQQGGSTMVIISARAETMDAAVDTRFGRAAFFVAVDVQTGAAQAHSNRQSLESTQGAGIQAAQFVAGLKPEAVISGNVGPKALRVLQAAGVRIYRCADGTVAEAVRRYQAGELQEVTAATVPGHWA